MCPQLLDILYLMYWGITEPEALAITVKNHFTPISPTLVTMVEMVLSGVDLKRICYKHATLLQVAQEMVNPRNRRSIRLAVLVPYISANADSHRIRQSIEAMIDSVNSNITLMNELRDRRLVAVYDVGYSVCNSSTGLAALNRILSQSGPIDGVLGPGCDSACESTAMLTSDLNLELGQTSYGCTSSLLSQTR